MKLLVFAHRGEAQAFFNHWNFSPVDFFFTGLFKSHRYYLLITGEGPKDASEKSVAVLSAFKDELDEVINIGIAGGLNPKLSIGDLIWVRSSYAHGMKGPEFKSYTTSFHQNLDCITATHRVTGPEEREVLSSFADIVDRELWSVMSAAHLFSLPAYSLKIVSDDSRSSDFCKLVKEEAPEWSKKLLSAFLEYEKKESTVSPALTPLRSPILEDKILTHEKLYFTTSQARRLHTLLRGIDIKKTLSEKEVLHLLQEFLSAEGERTPKELSKLFLALLDEKLNPLKTKIKNRISEAIAPLAEAGAQVSYDQELEQDYVQVSFQIRNAKDQKKMILALEQFNYQKIKDIFQGNLGDDL